MGGMTVEPSDINFGLKEAVPNLTKVTEERINIAFQEELIDRLITKRLHDLEQLVVSLKKRIERLES